MGSEIRMKFWDNDTRKTSASEPKAAPASNRPKVQQRKKSFWNYIGFEKTDDPSSNNGTKPVIDTQRFILTPEPDTPRPSRKRQKTDQPSRQRSFSPAPTASPVTVAKQPRPSAPLLPLLQLEYKLCHYIQGFSHESLGHRRYEKRRQARSNAKGRKKKDDSDDEDNCLNLWGCAYETGPEESAQVAICSAHSLLLLDPQQGRYTMKYTHPEEHECFFTSAWTRLPITSTEASSSTSGTSILAAAGNLGSIKLLDTSTSQCYRYLLGHEKSILKLAFVKQEPRWLFSASADKTIRLWDIGTTAVDVDDSRCLAIFPCNNAGFPTSLTVSPDLSLLVVGTSKGDLMQFEIEEEHREKWKQAKVDGDEPTVMKLKVKFPHSEEYHFGYVDGIHLLGQDGDTDHPLDGYAVSRSSGDQEFIAWRPDTSTKKDADIRVCLSFPNPNEASGIRFTVVEKDGCKVLISGDEDGDLRLYHLGEDKVSKTLKDGSKEQLAPERVLCHESSNHLIRDICVSESTKTIVAVNSDNSVFVWSADD
ncbi:WD40 repeat-like protein [Hesseltinella vesiculosa]|uniref:WD40 repeat-like protein n=1 Tax=Hesseltinella vesiculosa TaxID=101127 RepID=A0A1X2GTM0_9FUNG|nr:WD40 repeat-like protein [Hesseltinella vesiculosa]